MVLLMPILLILKPIVQAVNQVMQPFIKDAMNIMKAAAKTGDPTQMSSAYAASSAIMLSGLFALVIKGVGAAMELILKVVMNVLINIWSALVPFLDKIPGVSLEMLNSVTNSLISFKDSGSVMLTKATDDAIALVKSGSSTMVTDYTSAMNTMIAKTKELKKAAGSKSGIQEGQYSGSFGPTFVDLAQKPATFDLVANKDELVSRIKSGKYNTAKELLESLTS
jgi:hypothetical protein